MDLDLADALHIVGISVHAEGLIGEDGGDAFGHFVGVGHHPGGHDAAAVGTDPVIQRPAVSAFAHHAAVVGGKGHHARRRPLFQRVDHIGRQLVQSLGIGGADLQPVTVVIGPQAAPPHQREIFRMLVEVIFLPEIVQPAVPGAPRAALSFPVAAHEKVEFAALVLRHPPPGLISQAAAGKPGRVGEIQFGDLPLRTLRDELPQFAGHEPADPQLFFQKIRHAEPGADPRPRAPVVVVDLARRVVAGNMDVPPPRSDDEAFGPVDLDEAQHESGTRPLLLRLHDGQFRPRRLENIGLQIGGGGTGDLLLRFRRNDDHIIGLAVFDHRHPRKHRHRQRRGREEREFHFGLLDFESTSVGVKDEARPAPERGPCGL